MERIDHFAPPAAGMIILALVERGSRPPRRRLYQWHKSLGFVALALTAPRLAARLVSFSSALASPSWERSLAAVTQGSLYVLTLCAILSCWLVVSTSHLPVPTRFFDLFLIPNIAQLGPVAVLGRRAAHRLAAWGIAFLIALHVAGALKHHFVDGDHVLKRMLPRWRRLSPPPEIGKPSRAPWRLLLRLDASYLSAVGSDHLFIDHFIRREPRMLVGSPGDAVRREHAQADAPDTGAAKALA